MYNIFISDWVERFSKENVLVIKSEDTTGAKMSASYKRILQFLDISMLNFGLVSLNVIEGGIGCNNLCIFDDMSTIFRNTHALI